MPQIVIECFLATIRHMPTRQPKRCTETGAPSILLPQLFSVSQEAYSLVNSLAARNVFLLSCTHCKSNVWRWVPPAKWQGNAM